MGPCVEDLASRQQAWASANEGKAVDSVRWGCALECGIKRSNCAHRCHARCHPDSLHCPDVKCSDQTQRTCRCGNRKQPDVCGRGGPDDEGEIYLECDDSCTLFHRRTQLADAFGRNDEQQARPISFYFPNYNLKNFDPASDESPFSEFLLDSAQSYPISQSLESIEQTIINFIKDLDQQRHSFRPMSHINRRIVHELAQLYRLDSVSFDREPYRNVVITKRYDTNLLPISLVDYVHLRQKSAASSSSSSSSSGSGGAKSTSTSSTRFYPLLIHDLPTHATTKSLHDFFRPFQGEYRIRWIDGEQAMALFSSKTSMLTAFNQLNQPYAEYRLKLLTEDAIDLKKLSDNVPIPDYIIDKLHQLFEEHEANTDRDPDSVPDTSITGSMTQSERTWILTDELSKSTDSSSKDPKATASSKELKVKEVEEETKSEDEDEEVVDDWTTLCSSQDEDDDDDGNGPSFSAATTFFPSISTAQIVHRNAFSELMSSTDNQDQVDDENDDVGDDENDEDD